MLKHTSREKENLYQNTVQNMATAKSLASWFGTIKTTAACRFEETLGNAVIKSGRLRRTQEMTAARISYRNTLRATRLSQSW